MKHRNKRSTYLLELNIRVERHLVVVVGVRGNEILESICLKCLHFHSLFMIYFRKELYRRYVLHAKVQQGISVSICARAQAIQMCRGLGTKEIRVGCSIGSGHLCFLFAFFLDCSS